ncbi:hypothetical protein CJD36_003135 [Flavipsychrobacter stenotrophus]|uniref:Uncharacterized protein n=2 Tax=Flavipsychrobacter stenotrophus TaxID=2077091 RepID=A0A2S7T1M9_9BACT|nr:hypothetical protein CJD36_003135 [Flavipsychrobacter stenotrophus]
MALRTQREAIFSFGQYLQSTKKNTMEFTEQLKNYSLLTKRFIVGNENLNKEGVLAVCKLLNEMIKLNDQAIKKAFGSINYDRISASHYEIDFIDQAALGDAVEIESQYTTTRNDSLLIDIIIRKRTNKKITIGEGRFVFQSKDHVTTRMPAFA